MKFGFESCPAKRSWGHLLGDHQSSVSDGISWKDDLGHLWTSGSNVHYAQAFFMKHILRIHSIYLLYRAWKDTFVQLLWKWKSSPLWNALTFLPKGCSADLQKIKPQKLPFLIKNCLQPTIKKRSPPKIGIPFVENAFHKRTRPDQWCPIDRWDRVVLVGMV